MILKKICLLNQSEQHPSRSLCLATRRLYNKIHSTDENTTDYLVRFRNEQKVNEACNGSLISRGLQEHRMKILYTLYVTGFDALSVNEKKEAYKEIKEILYTILYLEKPDKYIFADLNKCIENNYVLNKA